jgi:hypothetical protein
VLGLDLDDGWLVALTETETIVFRQMASQQTPAAGA